MNTILHSQSHLRKWVETRNRNWTFLLRKVFCRCVCTNIFLPRSFLRDTIDHRLRGFLLSLFKWRHKSDRESRDGLKFNNKKRFENPITTARLFRHSDDYHKVSFMTTLIIEFVSRAWSCVENGRIFHFLARGDNRFVFWASRGTKIKPKMTVKDR